jgi:hypothetical protein
VGSGLRRSILQEDRLDPSPEFVVDFPYRLKWLLLSVVPSHPCVSWYVTRPTREVVLHFHLRCQGNRCSEIVSKGRLWAPWGSDLIVRREKAWVFSGCNSRPAKGSLQPVRLGRIGAAVEVTKPSKPSRQTSCFSRAARRQAVTRVNVEQASKRPMRVPTRRLGGEGCHRWWQGKRLE